MEKTKNKLMKNVRYKDLLIQLVERDIKLKYRRSFLGYVWSILNPLLIMIVMIAVFSRMFHNNIENYPVYLLTGQIMFNFMRNATNQALTSIVGNGALIKKTYVPKYIFTISKVTSGLVDFLFSLGALLVVMVITKTKFTLFILLFPFISLQLYFFCIGLGLFLAQANVFFRDIQYIYSVIITAWTYLTPMFYPIEKLSVIMQHGIECFNPMYSYISQFRSIILYGQMPQWDVVVRGCSASIIVMIIGIWSFKKTQDEFILYI